MQKIKVTRDRNEWLTLGSDIFLAEKDEFIHVVEVSRRPTGLSINAFSYEKEQIEYCEVDTKKEDYEGYLDEYKKELAKKSNELKQALGHIEQLEPEIDSLKAKNKELEETNLKKYQYATKELNEARAELDRLRARSFYTMQHLLEISEPK